MVFWLLKVVSVVVPVGLVVCWCLEWYFSRKERAQKLRQAIADTEWIIGLRDLGELGTSAAGISGGHASCGNRLRVGVMKAGNRMILYCPLCAMEVEQLRAVEVPKSSTVVSFDHYRYLAKTKNRGKEPPSTAA